MKSARLSNLLLAERLEVHPVTVTKWRKGAIPEPLRLEKLAQVLGVREEWLKSGKEPRGVELSMAVQELLGQIPTNLAVGTRAAAVAALSPRQVIRAAVLAIADHRERTGQDMPFEELTWWLGKVFEAGGRDTRQALAMLDQLPQGQ